jgi:hypothetical protein
VIRNLGYKNNTRTTEEEAKFETAEMNVESNKKY